MKKYIWIFLSSFILGGLITYLFFISGNRYQNVVPDTELIHQQIKNVSKLVVNEAKMSQIYNYKDEKSFMNIISFNKKALVVVNADVQIMYDLSKLEYVIDEPNKTVKILNIPKEEIKVSPEIKIYDIEASKFNQFEGADYNKIQEKVKAQFIDQIKMSNIQSNAKNRLVSELSKFLVVTQSLGWSLEYQNKNINKIDDMNVISN